MRSKPNMRLVMNFLTSLGLPNVCFAPIMHSDAILPAFKKIAFGDPKRANIRALAHLAKILHSAKHPDYSPTGIDYRALAQTGNLVLISNIDSTISITITNPYGDMFTLTKTSVYENDETVAVTFSEVFVAIDNMIYK
jgi:hypothetical protein